MPAPGNSQTNPNRPEHDRDASNPGIKNGVSASAVITLAKTQEAVGLVLLGL
jgi:hypothetical protein